MVANWRDRLAGIALALGAGLVLLVAVGARADGLVYQDPPDTAWAEYALTLRVKAGEQQREHSGLLRLSAVGKAKVGEAPYRWLEIAVSKTEPHVADEILKVLLPEKDLRAGTDLVGSVVKAFRKRGDGKVETAARDRMELGIGPVALFLAGPLREVKKLASEDVTVEGLGKLPCSRESGKGVLRFGKAPEVPAEYVVWRHPRPPFGTARMQVAVHLEKEKIPMEAVLEVRLARVGKDAKSALPDAR
jgi:hypothetical protein